LPMLALLSCGSTSFSVSLQSTSPVPATRCASSRAPLILLAETERLEAAFALFDVDGDGSITVDELGDVMRSLGKYPTEDAVQEMLTEFDADSNGTIGLDEFRTIMAHEGFEGTDALVRAAADKAIGAEGRTKSTAAAAAGPSLQEAADGFFETFERFNKAFNLFDVDGDGAITTTEMGDVMRSLGQYPTEDDLEAMMGQYDEDGNGTIDFEEFCMLMTRIQDEGIDAMVKTAVSKGTSK